MRDRDTYGKIAREFDRWSDEETRRPERERVLHPQTTYTPASQGPDMGRLVFAAIGGGIALLILLLAVLSFLAAASWSGFARDGAATGYTVVGVFLTIAGIGGALAVWNHNFRVLTRPTPPS